MYHLYICRPVGFALEAPDIGTWLMLFGYELGAHNATCNKEDRISLSGKHSCRERILAARNSGVYDARQGGATHLLFIDPDVCIDRYAGVGIKPQDWVVPWWKTAWDFMLDNPGCVIGAPYCGMLDPPIVQVFERDGDTHRHFQYEEVKSRKGWEQVSAIGTGLLLVDMKVFDAIDQKNPEKEFPYFDDLYEDALKRKIRVTPDVFFCDLCTDADVPVYVNWDFWIGHYQNQIVESPRYGNGRTSAYQGIPGRRRSEQGLSGNRSPARIPGKNGEGKRVAEVRGQAPAVQELFSSSLATGWL